MKTREGEFPSSLSLCALGLIDRKQVETYIRRCNASSKAIMDTDEKNATEFGTTSFTMMMTRQQSEVYELLRRFATERTNLHEWYQGALQTINSTSADKIAQAANSIREICDRLPDIADIPRFKNPISAAKSFGSQFLEVKRVSYSNGWQGKPIERPLNDILQRLEKIFGELAEATGLLHCDCFSFEWRFSHTKSAIGFLKKAPRAHRLLNVIAEFGSTPDRLGPMLELLHALLRRPSDDLRWAIQYKDIEPVISSGLASDIPTIQKLAKECKDLLLKMGFSAFLNLGQ